MYNLPDTILKGPTRHAVDHHFNSPTTLVFVLVALFAEFILAYVIIRGLVGIVRFMPAFISMLLRHYGIGSQTIEHSFLEIIFPSDTSKTSFATEQLHILLRNQVSYSHFWDRLAGHKRLHAFELVSTKDEGIRYVMVVPSDEVVYVEHSLRSYLPGVKIKAIRDYLTGLDDGVSTVSELKLTADFVLPLQDHNMLTEHDPIAYLTGNMTKLDANELIAFQIVATPVQPNTHHRVIQRIRRMETRIALNKGLAEHLITQRTPLNYCLWLLWAPLVWLAGIVLKVVTAVADAIGIAFSSSHTRRDVPKPNVSKQDIRDAYEQELSDTIRSKLSQQLYEVSIRVLVHGASSDKSCTKLHAIVSSFQSFTNTHQSIVVRRYLSLLSPEDPLMRHFKARTLSPHIQSQQTIVSSSELSSIYHFPETAVTKTEGLVKSRSSELPTPLSIKHSTAKLDVIVGVNKHGGDSQPIGMTLEQRQKHTYVIGKTGTGKTTLLTSSIYQDMVNGKGLAVLDPHGDMFQELLAIVPKHRRADVVIFDPSDREWPVGLNLLDPGIEFVNEDEKHERITSSVLSIFTKLADESQWGPRMEHILRNATMTALQVPDASLFTLQRLLTDKKYQKQVSSTLKDPVLKQFWQKEFALLGTMQLSSVTAPLTHRLGHFITTKMSRHILLQGKTTIQVADIMDEGKILLANLSKGDIGEDQSRFFGTILTSFIWMAAYQRTKIPEKQRRDFFFYVDEFQNFASPDFSDIVSEGRKYRISLTVSHQSIAQIEDMSIVKQVAGNASALIVLKVSPEDEAFILPYMKPEVTSGDIVNLAPYHFYMKTTSPVSEDAFSGETVLHGVEPSELSRRAVIASSHEQYGMLKADAEAYMDKLFDSTKPGKKDVIEKPAQSTDGHGTRRPKERFGL